MRILAIILSCFFLLGGVIGVAMGFVHGTFNWKVIAGGFILGFVGLSSIPEKKG